MILIYALLVMKARYNGQYSVLATEVKIGTQYIHKYKKVLHRSIGYSFLAFKANITKNCIQRVQAYRGQLRRG